MSTPAAQSAQSAQLQRIRAQGAALMTGQPWTPGQLEEAARAVLGNRALAAQGKWDDEAA